MVWPSLHMPVCNDVGSCPWTLGCTCLQSHWQLLAAASGKGALDGPSSSLGALTRPHRPCSGPPARRATWTNQLIPGTTKGLTILCQLQSSHVSAGLTHTCMGTAATSAGVSGLSRRLYPAGHLFDRFAALEQRAGGDEVGSPGGPGGARGKGQGTGAGDEEEEEEQQQDLELDEDDGDNMDDDYQTVGLC